MRLLWTYQFDRVAGVLLLALTCLAAGGFSIGAGKGISGQDTGQASKAKPKTSPSAKPKIVRRSEYVGDQACAQCHRDKFDTYEKTAHNLSSQIANQTTIVGTFTPGANTMTTANPNLSFEMGKKGEEFFQTAIWASPDGRRTAHAHGAPGPGDRIGRERANLSVLERQSTFSTAGRLLDGFTPMDYQPWLHRWTSRF